MYDQTALSTAASDDNHGDQRVLTADLDWRPLSAVSRGDDLVALDTVTNEDSQTKRLLRVATVTNIDRRRRRTVEIQTDDTTVTVAREATLLPRTHDYREAWRFRSDQAVRHVLTPTPDTDSAAYRDGYVHGAFAGDGSTVETETTKSATLRCQDEAIIDRVDAFARDEYGLKRKGTDSNGLHEIRTTIWDEVDHMEAVDPIDTTQLGDPEYCRGWLAGMFDTDGAFDGWVVRFTQQKPKQREYLQQLLEFLGFDYEPEPDAIRVRGPNSRLRILSLIRPAVSRKVRKYQTISFNGSTTVKEVSKYPVGDTYDISLDVGDAYILEGVCVGTT